MEQQARKELAERIRRGRLRKGWNGEDLAHQAGVSVRTVSRYETAQVTDPREHTLTRLARALGVSRDELAGPRVTPEELERAYEQQLDRIERKLDELLERLVEQELEAAGEQDKQPEHGSGAAAGASRRKPPA